MAFTLTPVGLAASGSLRRAPIPTEVAPMTKKPKVAPRWIFVALTRAGAVIACAVTTVAIVDDGFQAGVRNAPVDGMTIFAVIFVAALAIERLLEPVSSWLVPTQTEKKKSSDADD